MKLFYLLRVNLAPRSHFPSEIKLSSHMCSVEGFMASPVFYRSIQVRHRRDSVRANTVSVSLPSWFWFLQRHHAGVLVPWRAVFGLLLGLKVQIGVAVLVFGLKAQTLKWETIRLTSPPKSEDLHLWVWSDFLWIHWRYGADRRVDGLIFSVQSFTWGWCES